MPNEFQTTDAEERKMSLLMNPTLVLKLQKGTSDERGAAAEICRLVALVEERDDFIKARGLWEEFEKEIEEELQRTIGLD